MVSVDEYRKDFVFGSLPRTVRGFPVVLNVSPDAKKLLYCNGNCVYIRNIQDWKECDVYSEHSTLTTVAKYSPSGFYIASGDKSGKIRIWDATQPTHILKSEHAVLSGAVRDIAWSDDSKRVAVVGEGRDRFGHVFLFDTGTSNGNLTGQSRSISSIDFRPARPYRLITGSEDYSVAIFEGPPFKFKTLYHSHSRFVHCTRYSPDGSLFASAGADGKVLIYEGLEGTECGKLIDESCKDAAHSGGVYSLCWSPDGQQIATASGDKTIKIWNVPDKRLEKTICMGSTVDDLQLSVVWAEKVLISVNFSGALFKLDPYSGEILESINGHNKPITAVVLALGESSKFAFTADFEGNITRWCLSSGMSSRLSPSVHQSQIVSMLCIPSGLLISVAWDDHVAFIQGALNEKTDNMKSVKLKLSSQPRGLGSSSDGSMVVVACQKSIQVYRDKVLEYDYPTNFESTCLAMKPDAPSLIVGAQDNKVRILLYNKDKKEMTISNVMVHSGPITSVAWSPALTHIVATDGVRKVVPYSVVENVADQKGFPIASEKDWTFHSARVTSCAFSKCGRYIATGGIDTNIIVWDLQNSGEHPIIIRCAHPGPVNAVAWIDGKHLLSVGQDSVLKIWSLNL